MARPVLICGAGIAGLWAALKLAPHPVILLTGAPLGEGAASGWAQGGVAAALAEDDTPDLHAADTIAAGAGLVDASAAAALAQDAAREVRALAALGAPFERDAQTWSLSREAAIRATASPGFGATGQARRSWPHSWGRCAGPPISTSATVGRRSR